MSQHRVRKIKMGQEFGFRFADSLLSEAGEIELSKLHSNLSAILKAYESIKPLAKRLGVGPPVPRLAGFTYPHVASLGARIDFTKDGEPKPFPIIHELEDIDKLKEPEDYLSVPLIQERIKLCNEIRKRSPASPKTIGHKLEGR